MYDSRGYVSYTEYYRVFQEQSWPLAGNQNEEQGTSLPESQRTLPLPGNDNGEDSEEHKPQQSVAWTTNLMVTTTTVDCAELSEDKINDDGDAGGGVGGGGSDGNEESVGGSNNGEGGSGECGGESDGDGGRRSCGSVTITEDQLMNSPDVPEPTLHIKLCCYVS